MSHPVRTHKRTVNGKTVTVRRHAAADPAAQAAKDQRKRDAFERRALAERQRAVSPAAYAGTTRRAPGERRRKKRGPKPARAKRHAKKALRLWRRHKAKALLYGGLALGEITAWAACRGASRVRAGIRNLRRGKAGKK